jgi:hypothetical protein
MLFVVSRQRARAVLAMAGITAAPIVRCITTSPTTAEAVVATVVARVRGVAAVGRIGGSAHPAVALADFWGKALGRPVSPGAIAGDTAADVTDPDPEGNEFDLVRWQQQPEQMPGPSTN